MTTGLPTFEHVLTSVADGIGTVTLNRPDKLNAFAGTMRQEVAQAVREMADHEDVRVLVITGAGRAFCAGGDVKKMRERASGATESGLTLRASYRDGIQRIPKAVYDLEVPTIAAVNGAAVGAGCDLVCMCDIRIASERARFAESFVRLGIIPGDGGAWLLPRAIGMSRAAEMTFTGDMIDAETAAAWGLVSKVVAADQLLDETRTLAERIAANPPAAVRMSKRLLRDGQTMGLSASLEMAAAFQSLAHRTSDHVEAINAFFDKRVGQYTGE